MLSPKTSDLSRVFGPITKRPQRAMLWNSSFSLWAAVHTCHPTSRLGASASGLAAGGSGHLGEQRVPCGGYFLVLKTFKNVAHSGVPAVFSMLTKL